MTCPQRQPMRQTPVRSTGVAWARHWSDEDITVMRATGHEA
ncbi:hypothetical protein QF027_000872 [Streptomyces canus]|nr:hypothetical protein [Streptomyces canus]